jgi:hypothetical protein
VELKGYRKLLKEISDGFSAYFIGEKKVLIKHQSNSDLVDFDDVYEAYSSMAQKRGLPSEKEILEDLKSEGIWTDEDDSEIESQSFYLENLVKNKKNIVLKSALGQINKQISQAEDQLNSLRNKKSGLTANSCESYALNRANDFYIVNSFYKDKSFKEPLYTKEEYEYAEASEVSSLVSHYNNFHERFSELSIQNLVLQDFYRIYFAFCETSNDFFGKPIMYLTNFQLNLIVYTRIFKNVFEMNEDIPEKIKKDPEALLDFANSSEAREDMKKKFSGDKGASTIVGATKEDMEELGMQQNTGVSLSEAAKKKGGSLSMKDLMDISGA